MNAIRKDKKDKRAREKEGNRSLKKEMEKIQASINDTQRNIEQMASYLAWLEDYIQSELQYIETKLFDVSLSDSPSDNRAMFKEMFPEAEDMDIDESEL